MVHLLRRPICFGLVGISGIVVNTAILAFLVWVVALPVWASSAIATEAAIISNFLFNDRWTFRAERAHRSTWQRMLRFNGVALGGLVITTGLLTLLTTYSHLPLLLANLLAIGSAVVWNYAMNSWWTWRRPRVAIAQPVEPGKEIERDTTAACR